MVTRRKSKASNANRYTFEREALMPTARLVGMRITLKMTLQHFITSHNRKEKRIKTHGYIGCPDGEQTIKC